MGEEKINRITIKISKNLKSIKGSESLIIVSGNLVQNINVTGKALFINNNESIDQLPQVHLNAINTRVNVNATIDSINLNLKNSNADIQSSMDFLKADLKNNTKLITSEALYKMEIVKDLTSKLKVY